MTLLHQAAQKAVEVLTEARDRIACSVCYHDETQRRGFIWTECLQCGAMFADDKGGVPAPKEPKELAQIDAAIAQLSAALQHQEVPREPVAQRAQFEGWAARTLGIDNFDCTDDEEADYLNPDTDDLWRCWQEAASSTEEVPRELELREAAKQFHNLTQGDSEVIIRPPSAEKRDAIVAAGQRLRAALACQCGVECQDLRDGCRYRAASPSTTRQQEVGSGWRPIATAPKDGREIILRDGTRVGAACWVKWPDTYDNDGAPAGDGGEGWTVGYDGNEWADPTHWQPLPAAPSTPEKAGGVSDGVDAPLEGQQ